MEADAAAANDLAAAAAADDQAAAAATNEAVIETEEMKVNHLNSSDVHFNREHVEAERNKCSTPGKSLGDKNDANDSFDVDLM
jgi:hypothetical protein